MKSFFPNSPIFLALFFHFLLFVGCGGNVRQRHCEAKLKSKIPEKRAPRITLEIWRYWNKV